MLCGFIDCMGSWQLLEGSIPCVVQLEPKALEDYKELGSCAFLPSWRGSPGVGPPLALASSFGVIRITQS